MLNGCDISHHNGNNAVDNILANDFTIDFFFVKATEGATYRDVKCTQNCDDVIKLGKLLGLYHYARPENNSPEIEALNFVAVFDKYKGFAIPALDWEGKALEYPADWAREWCDLVFYSTGVRPVIYAQYSALKDLSAVALGNYGLWVAKWGSKPSNVTPWDTWAIWQYTNRDFDKNMFNGTKEQFLKYCAVVDDNPDNSEPNEVCTCYCGCCYKKD